MNHLTEEELILHYYGEEGDSQATRQHLDQCERCRAIYGRFERVLDPGAHHIWDARHACMVETFKVVATSFPMDRIRLLQSVAPEVARRYFEVVTAEPEEIVFVLFDGETKFYVTPRSFIYAMANYGWLFRHDEAIAARFSTGLWNWGVGVGFNF